jgi:hypothetical protein
VPASQAITFEQRALRAAQTAIGFPLDVAVASPDRVCIAVTVQGGSGEPQLKQAGGDEESGRGLLVVTQSAATSAPGEAVIRIEGILRVNMIRLITGSPGKLEV